ncbi:unnamed protein product, partial [Nesidiocoris tenuis]
EQALLVVGGEGLLEGLWRIFKEGSNRKCLETAISSETGEVGNLKPNEHIVSVVFTV